MMVTTKAGTLDTVEEAMEVAATGVAMVMVEAMAVGGMEEAMTTVVAMDRVISTVAASSMVVSD